MSSVKECVKSRYVSKLWEDETLAPRCRISFDEFRLGMTKALNKTGVFTSEEIKDIEGELLAGLQNKASCLTLVSAPHSQHLLAKKLGLPSLHFVFRLKEETSARTPTQPTRPLREYLFDLTPDFYVLLLQSIPSLKFDFTDSTYSRLTESLARSPFPRMDGQLSNKQRSLNRIKAAVITIARLLRSPVPTESLLRYSKRAVFPTRSIAAKTVNFLTKKRSTHTAGGALNNHPPAYNCQRCPATIPLSENFALEENSLPPQYQMVNISHLEAFQNKREGLRHYYHLHLKRRGEPPPDLLTTCVLLIPCKRCVSAFLASGRVDIAAEDNLFFCCAGNFN